MEASKNRASVFVMLRFPADCERGENEEVAESGGVCAKCAPTVSGSSAEREEDSTAAAKRPPPSGRCGKRYRLCTECGASVQNLAKHLKMHRGVKPDRSVPFFKTRAVPVP